MDFLYNCLWTEARGESLKGQIFVLNVIDNRLKDYRWPSTLQAVIEQPYQFSISNYTTEIPKLRFLTEMYLEGFIPKITRATHFHTVTSSPYWSFRMEYIESVGNHKFYRV